MRKDFLFMVLITLILSSCSSRDGVDVIKTPEEHAHRHPFSFRIALSGGDPVTYASIQTDGEKRLDRLDIFQFGIGDEGTFETMYPDVKLTSSSTGYTASIDIVGTGDKQFFFVANNMNELQVPVYNLVKDKSKASDFLKMVTFPISGSNLKAPLLMTAHKPSVTISASTPNQSVELERIMSRLDIRNYESSLTITRVRMERLSDRSFIFHQKSTKPEEVLSQNPSDVKKVTLPERNIPETSNDEIEIVKVNAIVEPPTKGYTMYNHVLYPYVQDAVKDQGEAPLLIIEGTLFKGDLEKEVKVVYSKPMKISGGENFLGFSRNNRYTLIIKQAVPGYMNADIKVDQWNQETLEIPVEPLDPKITGLYNIGDYGDNAKYSYQESMLLLTKIGFNINLILNVSSNTDWEVLPYGQSTPPSEDGMMCDWLTAKPVKTYWGGVVPENTINDGLGFIVKENTTGKSRIIRLVLRSKVDNSKRFVLNVEQKG